MAQTGTENESVTTTNCSICRGKKVEKREAINRALGNGTSYRDIEVMTGVAYRTIGNHAQHLPAIYREAKEKGILAQSVDVEQEFKQQLLFAKKLRIAAEGYLTDSETGEIVLIPRATEVDVIYEDYDDLTRSGEPKRKRAKLDTLVEKLESVRQFQIDLLKLDFERIAEKYDDDDYEDFRIEIFTLLNAYKTDYINALKIEIKHVDIRSFALDAIKTADATIDKFARMGGAYQKDRENDDAVSKLKLLIENRARDKNVAYQDELKNFLDNYSDDVMPKIKTKLASELIQ